MTTSSPVQKQVNTRVDDFTLIFPRGEIAVLEVFGASTKDEARTIAASVLPGCAYDVQDGDCSDGKAFCFYSWASAQAQETWV